MKTSKIMLLPLLVTGLLAGCNGSSGSNEVTLTIWEDESNVEVVKYLANEWAGVYRTTYPSAPKINIVVQKQSEKSAIEKMGQVASTGHGPDIASVTHDTIAGAVSNKLLAPVSFHSEIEEYMADDALSAVQVNDDYYGYPITAESMTVMYDSDQISAEELASFETLKASGKKIGLQLTNTDGGYYCWGFYNDSNLFGPDGKDPKSVDIATENTVNNVYSLFHDYTDCFFDYEPETNLSHVKAGRIAGLITSPFLYASMKEALGSKLKLAKLPTINGQDLRPFSGYKAYVVSRYSTNGALAQELAKYLTNVDSQAYRLSELGYLPATDLEASEDIKDLIAGNEHAAVFAESLARSMVMPNIPEMANFWKPINNAQTSFKTNAASLTKDTVRETLQGVTTALLGNK